MSPIERVRARVEAFEVLGVDRYSDESEIRAAWRRTALEAHPDQGGEVERFKRAKAAFEFLMRDEESGRRNSENHSKKASVASAPPRPRVARPKITRHESALSPEVQAECRALLGSEQAQVADGGGSSVPDKSCTAVVDLKPGEHVPEAVDRCGRSLTYRVATPLLQGLNRVALPTALLLGRARPEIVTFRATEGGRGDIVVPDNVRERLFPGAHNVRIRFCAA